MRKIRTFVFCNCRSEWRWYLGTNYMVLSLGWVSTKMAWMEGLIRILTLWTWQKFIFWHFLFSCFLGLAKKVEWPRKRKKLFLKLGPHLQPMVPLFWTVLNGNIVSLGPKVGKNRKMPKNCNFLALKSKKKFVPRLPQGWNFNAKISKRWSILISGQKGAISQKVKILGV